VEPEISVIYCTARQGGLDILKESMEQQTFKEFEVLVLDELHRTSGFIDITPPKKKDGMFWNLSASLNEGVRHAKGELIVLLQDYIKVPPDGLQKFWNRHLQEPKGLISGVGDQFDAKTGVCTFADPRKQDVNNHGFYLGISLLWEANWGCFPRQAWVDVGGFDERYDSGWGYDNTDFAERCGIAGYHTFLDTDNEVYCISHIKLFNEQGIRDKAPNNMKLYQKLSRDWYKGQEPWKLNYASPL